MGIRVTTGVGLGICTEVGAAVGVGVDVGGGAGGGGVGAGVDVCAVAYEVSMPCAASPPPWFVQANSTRQPTRPANSSAITARDKMFIPFSRLPQLSHLFQSFGDPIGILSANAQIPNPLPPSIPIVVGVGVGALRYVMSMMISSPATHLKDSAREPLGTSKINQPSNSNPLSNF